MKSEVCSLFLVTCTILPYIHYKCSTVQPSAVALLTGKVRVLAILQGNVYRSNECLIQLILFVIFLPIICNSTLQPLHTLCVCVCVCVREREREREMKKEDEEWGGGGRDEKGGEERERESGSCLIVCEIFQMQQILSIYCLLNSTTCITFVSRARFFCV